MLNYLISQAKTTTCGSSAGAIFAGTIITLIFSVLVFSQLHSGITAAEKESAVLSAVLWTETNVDTDDVDQALERLAAAIDTFTLAQTIELDEAGITAAGDELRSALNDYVSAAASFGDVGEVVGFGQSLFELTKGILFADFEGSSNPFNQLNVPPTGGLHQIAETLAAAHGARTNATPGGSVNNPNYVEYMFAEISNYYLSATEFQLVANLLGSTTVFPNGIYTPAGAAVEISVPTTTQGAVFAKLDLLDGIPETETVVEVIVDYTALQADQEPVFGVTSDGAFWGATLSENAGGSAGFMSGTVDAGYEITSSTYKAAPIGSALGMQPSGPVRVTLRLLPNHDVSPPTMNVTVTEFSDDNGPIIELAGGVAFNPANITDPTAAWYFVIANTAAGPDGVIDATGEVYSINSVAMVVRELQADLYTIDSDGDMLSDGQEAELGTNPDMADTDGDGLADGMEQTLQTNPLSADTDGDGIDDLTEGTVTWTSPTVADSDGDGVSDGLEFYNGSDPLNNRQSMPLSAPDLAPPLGVLTPDDISAYIASPFSLLPPNTFDFDDMMAFLSLYDRGTADFDSDGLSNFEEEQAGTNPYSWDTDGDGLSDYLEVSDGRANTDPASADTDGDGILDGDQDSDSDGLSDFEESVLGTDPLNPDSDGDLVNDGDEYYGGSNPVDGSDLGVAPDESDLIRIRVQLQVPALGQYVIPAQVGFVSCGDPNQAPYFQQTNSVVDVAVFRSRSLTESETITGAGYFLCNSQEVERIWGYVPQWNVHASREDIIHEFDLDDYDYITFDQWSPGCDYLNHPSARVRHFNAVRYVNRSDCSDGAGSLVPGVSTNPYSIVAGDLCGSSVLGALLSPLYSPAEYCSSYFINYLNDCVNYDSQLLGSCFSHSVQFQRTGLLDYDLTAEYSQFFSNPDHHNLNWTRTTIGSGTLEVLRTSSELPSFWAGPPLFSFADSLRVSEGRWVVRVGEVTVGLARTAAGSPTVEKELLVRRGEAHAIEVEYIGEHGDDLSYTVTITEVDANASSQFRLIDPHSVLASNQNVTTEHFEDKQAAIVVPRLSAANSETGEPISGDPASNGPFVSRPIPEFQPNPAFPSAMISVENVEVATSLDSVLADIRIAASIEDELAELDGYDRHNEVVVLLNDEEIGQVTGPSFNVSLAGTEVAPGWNIVRLAARNDAGVIGFVERGFRIDVEDVPGDVGFSFLPLFNRGTGTGNEILMTVDPTWGGFIAERQVSLSGAGTTWFSGEYTVTFSEPIETASSNITATITAPYAGVDGETVALGWNVSQTRYEGTVSNITVGHDYSTSDVALGAYSDHVGSGPGELHPYAMTLLKVPSGLDQLIIDELVGPGVSFDMNGSESFDLVRVGDFISLGSNGLPEKFIYAEPGTFDFDENWEIPDPEPRNGSDEFMIGFSVGVYETGPALVNDGKAVLQTVWYVVENYNPVSTNIRVIGGGWGNLLLEEDKQKIQGVWDVGAPLAQAAYEFVSGNIDMQYRMMLGDAEAYREYGAQGVAIMELASEVFDSIQEYWDGLDDYQKGKLAGRIFGEIAIEVAGTALTGGVGTAAKAVLRSGRLPAIATKVAPAIGRIVPQLDEAAALAKITDRINDLLTTRMCFTAGTIVAVRGGFVPIESLIIGDEVLARSESDGRLGFRRITDTITSYSGQIYTLQILKESSQQFSGGEGVPEQFRVTGEHPFFSMDRSSFVPVSDLYIGERVGLAEGGALARVVGIDAVSNNNENVFITYNISVDEYSTYFVGSQGVWVHNLSSDPPCERVYRLFEHLKRNNPNSTSGDLFESVEARIAGIARAEDRDSLLASTVDRILADDGELFDLNMLSEDAHFWTSADSYHDPLKSLASHWQQRVSEGAAMGHANMYEYAKGAVELSARSEGGGILHRWKVTGTGDISKYIVDMNHNPPRLVIKHVRGGVLDGEGKELGGRIKSYFEQSPGADWQSIVDGTDVYKSVRPPNAFE